MATHALRQDLGRARGRARPDLHRPAPRARGHLAAGVREPAAGRPPGPPPRPDARHRRPQRPDRRLDGRRSDPRPPVARPGRDARAQLPRVRRSDLLDRLGAPGDRPRDRPRARRHAAGHDDRLRRLAHVDARRLRRARVRHRHERGRARARHADAAAVEAALDGDPLRGRARLRRDREGPDPRHDRPDRHRRRRRARDRVRRARDREALDGGPDDGLQHDDRGRRARGHDRAGRHDVRVGRRPRRRSGRACPTSGATCTPTTAPRSTRRSSSTPRALSPQVTWGTTPGMVVPVTEAVPEPQTETDERALKYMDLEPGTPIQDIRLDRVFVGLVHELADRRPARRGRGARRPQGPPGRRGDGRARLAAGEGAGRGGGARRGLPRRRLRLALGRLLDVPRDEPGHPPAGRALRVHLEPQLRGPPGPRRPHAPRQPADGRRRRGRGPLRRHQERGADGAGRASSAARCRCSTAPTSTPTRSSPSSS